MDNDRENAACSCCGHLTLPREHRSEICPVCFWESDPIQNDDESYSGGANSLSLAAAKLNYQKFGSATIEGKNYVRLPLDSEINRQVIY
jgi:Cysteine-rich CPCC